MAIDLEFDKNLRRYGFNLCLMQVFCDGECFLVDPLSKDMDLSRLFPVLEDEAIEKVTYAFGEDLRLLISLGCYPQNIFDLGIAACLLDYPQPSLTRFLDEVLEIETVRSSQKSNWYTRPLSPQQVNYAADDVVYLLEAKEAVIEMAKQKEVLDWIREENSLLDVFATEARNNPATPDSTPYAWKDSKFLTEYQWLLFRRIMEVREDLAQKMNRPSQHLFHKNLALDLVKDLQLIDRWTQQKGLHPKLKNNNFASKLRAIVQQCNEEAQREGISKTKPAQKRRSREEMQESRERRNRVDRLKDEVFKPIRELIADQWGENTAGFLFGNRTMEALIEGKAIRFPEYRKQLLISHAAKLDLDVSPYV